MTAVAKTRRLGDAATGNRVAIRSQLGALVYRVTKDAEVEVLLVGTRKSGHWIIPKGWPMKGMKAWQAAAREAYEEAGVRGKVTQRSLGAYVYDKILDETGVVVPCEVSVFALAFKSQEKKWPERGQRQTLWAPLDEAPELVEQAELRSFLAGLTSRSWLKPRKSGSQPATPGKAKN